jgi:hypothetical protein
MMPLSDELAIGLGDSKGKPTGFLFHLIAIFLLRPARTWPHVARLEIAPLLPRLTAAARGRSSTGHLRQAEGALPVQRLKAR